MTHVMVIESEPWLGDHYQRHIERAGFSVVRASNAYTAIDLVDTQLPAAIVLNLFLSGPSAIGLLHELQSYTDTTNIPVIVCGNVSDISMDDLRPYGVTHMIDSRTMQPDDLPAALRSALAL